MKSLPIVYGGECSNLAINVTEGQWTSKYCDYEQTLFILMIRLITLAIMKWTRAHKNG